MDWIASASSSTCVHAYSRLAQLPRRVKTVRVRVRVRVRVKTKPAGQRNPNPNPNPSPSPSPSPDPTPTPTPTPNPLHADLPSSVKTKPALAPLAEAATRPTGAL